MPANKKYGSDVMVDLFKLYDFEYASLNPGSSFRGLHDSMVNYGKNVNPEMIECCHEEIPYWSSCITTGPTTMTGIIKSKSPNIGIPP